MAKSSAKQKYKKNFIQKYLNKTFFQDLLTNVNYLNATCSVLLVVEIILNIGIVHNVKYTEIDWVAYMQEVEGFLNGTLDYKQLRGDTGPLVYPAGFVYVYSILYYVTSHGTNILVAQYLFIAVYITQLYFVFNIYKKTAKVPPYALAICIFSSYRIHSIYVLRLFNDTIAVLFFYVSLNAFISNYWIVGSTFYSLAVAVKMNILLYAPCLLITYLTNLTIKDTLLNIFVCGVIQLILGLPFLLNNPISYLMASFDVGRIFEFKWTVNYRFLTRETFESRHLHISLIALHILLLIIFLPHIKRYLISYAKLNRVTKDLKNDEESKRYRVNYDTNSRLIVLPFFVTNLIGVTCARSLHYQFYSWYYHSLLYLTFCTGYRTSLIFLLLGVIELCWNIYPSTSLSSLSLHICHAVLLFGVYNYMKK